MNAVFIKCKKGALAMVICSAVSVAAGTRRIKNVRDPHELNDVDVGNLHHAYHRSGFFAANYAVLMSGPSATAGIEGVLIHGAHEGWSLSVIPAPRVRAFG